MYKGNIATGQTITANTNIPFTTVFDNCYKLQYNSSDNTISILKAGIYDVTVNLPITSASASPLTLALYANGILIADSVCVNDITVTTGVKTLQIIDTIKVGSSLYPNVAKISVKLSGNAETYDVGNIIIQERSIKA